MSIPTGGQLLGFAAILVALLLVVAWDPVETRAGAACSTRCAAEMVGEQDL